MLQEYDALNSSVRLYPYSPMSDPSRPILAAAVVLKAPLLSEYEPITPLIAICCPKISGKPASFLPTLSPPLSRNKERWR